MDDPQRKHRHVKSYDSIGSIQHAPKQYRILGLASPLSSPTLLSSASSSSTAIGTFPSPPLKTATLSDHLSNLIQHITRYFHLFKSLPLTLFDYNLRMEQPKSDNSSAYRKVEIEFCNCLRDLRDTLWFIQTRLRDEDEFVRTAFGDFESHVKGYLVRCLKGWKGVLLTRGCTRHYRSICGIRRVLRTELKGLKEIMNAVGPHCKLLDVDVEVIGEWLVNLDESRKTGAEIKEAPCR